MPTVLPPSLSTFDDLPVAGAVLDLDGTVIAVNRAALAVLVRGSADVIGKKAWDIAPGIEHAWQDIVRGASDRGEHADHISIATPHGVRALDYVATRREVEGRPVLLIFASDVTRHKHAQEIERARADLDSKQRIEAIGLVAGGIAHDFNNQLVSVLAEATAAYEDPALGEASREALRRIEAAASRMAQLTRQLLAYAGRGRFVTELIDPDELVRQSVEALQRLARVDAELLVTTSAGSLAIEGDRGLLGQVIANLVSNASDALGPSGGRITVATSLTARTGGAWWQLDVSDQGEGIDASTLARIFDPFFTTKGDRHGLGLSAVHGIVRRFGGDIEVESKVGGGTRFRVRLPVIPGAEPQPTRRTSQSVGGATLAGIRALVADDEPSVRATVRRLLERRGATVVLACDGLEAAEKLGEGSYAVVLFDVMMPGRTGYELLPIARKLQPGASVMLMSGYTERARGAGTEDEPDRFLEKPFTAKILDAAIDQVIKQRR